MKIDDQKCMTILLSGGYRHDTVVVAGLQSGELQIIELNEMSTENLIEIYEARLRLTMTNTGSVSQDDGVEFCKSVIDLAKSSIFMSSACLGSSDASYRSIVVFGRDLNRVVACKKLGN